MNNLKSIIMLLLGAMIIWGAPAYADQELIVSAAASLTNAMKEVAGQFEKTHPGVKIVCNFAASGVLSSPWWASPGTHASIFIPNLMRVYSSTGFSIEFANAAMRLKCLKNSWNFF